MPKSVLTRSLGPRILLYGMVPGLLLLVAFGYLALGSVRLDQDRAAVRRINDVLSTATSIEIAIKDTERGQRGFLLTGEEPYLTPYNNGISRIAPAIARLQALTADEPEQQTRILSLQRALTTKLDELARTIELQRTQGHDVALAYVTTNIGARAMDDVLRDLADISSSEQTIRTRQVELNAATRRELSLASLGGGILAMVTLAWITATVYRFYQRAVASEATLQATLDSVPVGVAAFDAAWRLIAWNQTFLNLAHVPSDDLTPGLPLASIPALGPGGATGEGLGQLDARARRLAKPLRIEHERPDRSVIEILHTALGTGGFVTTFCDISERRLAELRRRQTQKMEALGQMTGGIAHDFNNLLTIIVGNLDMLKTRLGDDPRFGRHVDLALMGAHRGAQLTHQLLAFARKQPLEPRPVNLAQLLPDLVEMLRRTLGELIQIEVVGTPGLWHVSIDPHQFESAVLNLAINARDAMPDGGKLTLETANVWLDDAYAARHDEVQAGQYVVFSVTDTGTGMPADVAARAFDPFFSTKGDGGTGLGLSMVFGFVKQSGGHIKLYSEEGHGTTIKLYLPRSLEEVATDQRSFVAADSGGSETILVVEDDESVRMTVTAMLAGFGYRVLEAANGATALTVLESAEPIDLLFTDVIMPGSVSSKALAEHARQLRPGIKILFTSGYTENTIVHNGRLDPGIQLISKPYGREQLAQKVRAVLGRAEPSASGTA